MKSALLRTGSPWLLLLALLFVLVHLAASPEDGRYEIFVDVDAKQLTLFHGQEITAVYPIATGAWDTPTPLGVFRINSRFHGQMSGFGTCFLGLSVPWGNYGIHGTNRPESIGANASHGCIRLRVQDAEALYAAVPNGTVVVIQQGAYGEMGDTLRLLKPGDCSSMVRAVQRRLRALGYAPLWPDGVFGEATRRAVLRARRSLALPEGERVDWALYQALGLTLFE